MRTMQKKDIKITKDKVRKSDLGKFVYISAEGMTRATIGIFPHSDGVIRIVIDKIDTDSEKVEVSVL
jgi:hypothetical protein